MKKIITFVFTLPVCLFVYSDETCTYDVQRVAVNSSGTVRLTASQHPGYFTVCSINSSWNSISVNVCNGWLSQAQIAYTSGMKLDIFYPDGTSCNTHTSNPAPKWLILQK